MSERFVNLQQSISSINRGSGRLSFQNPSSETCSAGTMDTSSSTIQYTLDSTPRSIPILDSKTFFASDYGDHEWQVGISILDGEMFFASNNGDHEWSVRIPKTKTGTEDRFFYSSRQTKRYRRRDTLLFFQTNQTKLKWETLLFYSIHPHNQMKSKRRYSSIRPKRNEALLLHSTITKTKAEDTISFCSSMPKRNWRF